MIDVAGERTTAASEILRDNVADARRRASSRACARRERSSLGKLNTHEFAFGALTTSPHFGPAHNPWAPDRDLRRLERRQRCGGRRRPRCRHARHRHGRLGPDPRLLLRRHRAAPVDRARARTTASSPSSWSFDTVGPIARSAEDCSLLLEALAPSYRPELDGGVARPPDRRRRRALRPGRPDDRGAARVGGRGAARARRAGRAGRRAAARGGRDDRRSR